jgi:flotillin
MALTLLFIVGLLLLAAPILLPIFGINIPLSATFAMLGVGGSLVGLIGLLWIFKKLYVKTRADLAFVRTGRGFKIIKDGGSIVIPFLHEIIWVSLRTFEVKVERRDKDALLTKDKLRANIAAEFYVKVKPDDDAIGAASRSFGEEMNAHGILRIVEKKLISNLRTVAAQKTLEELNSDRAAFMEQVTHLCAQDLIHNGLTLESAAISSLDQTSSEHLDPKNVFDAQGLRTIADITEANMTHTNKLQRNGEEARKRQDVETRKAMLSLEQEREKAEAEQIAEIKRIKAEQGRLAREKEIEATKAVELAEVEKHERIEVAKKAQEQAVEVAAQAKEQAVEVATRAKEAAISTAEKERAEKQAEQADAERLRQEKTEAIKTVTMVQEAERKKQQAIIEAQAEAERKLISAQKGADAEAYKVEKDAAARKAAADADAEATRKKAEADKDAEIARAEGEKARAMVPIEVKKAELAIEKSRIEEVVKPELEARDAHGQSAQEFELAKLYIEEHAKVEIERAKASVEIYRKVEVQAFTTLEQMAAVQQQVVRGHGLAGMINGFRENLDVDSASEAVGAIKSIIEAIRGSQPKSGSNGAPEPKTVAPSVSPAPAAKPTPAG